MKTAFAASAAFAIMATPTMVAGRPLTAPILNAPRSLASAARGLFLSAIGSNIRIKCAPSVRNLSGS